jgi:SM-20-related protein
MTAPDPAQRPWVLGLGAALNDVGWADLQGRFDEALLLSLHDEASAHALALRLVPATTGRIEGRLAGSVRGDSTLWLDDPACGPAAARFLVVLDGLRIELNRSLMLGLHEVEAQFAVYPPGAGYTRHRDRFRDDDARVVSLVCYLNADWPDDAGGALRLHLDGGDHDIAPRSGTTVLFMSADIEHEVMPATCTRTSIAAWFRRNPC